MMRPQDERAFEDAARSVGVWILVRRTKPAALAYIVPPLSDGRGGAS
jgi:hypothetical protein